MKTDIWTSNTNLDALLDRAIQAAQQAGRHALENKARRDEIAHLASHDIKLQLDLECQDIAQNCILGRFPHHHILGEEGEQQGGSEQEPEWIIDPIDGTVNFAHGLPLWCSSVAVRLGDHILAGAVYIPELDELYAARCDKPATCNGVNICVSGIETLEESIILMGLSKHIERGSVGFDLFHEVAVKAMKARLMGAAAVDLCHVAAGKADGYIESSIYIWDVAAGGLIAQQAGASVEVLEKYDERRFQYICTNGRIHDELKAIAKKVLGDGSVASSQ